MMVAVHKVCFIRDPVEAIGFNLFMESMVFTLLKQNGQHRGVLARQSVVKATQDCSVWTVITLI